MMPNYDVVKTGELMFSSTVAISETGFIAGLRTTEQISLDLCHIFIDFKEAFDVVWHATLWPTV